ncbi:MAG: hypothetical protein CBD00_05965 [Rhodospirillaceae bacterium TMED140]|nr:hypothetical protein [Rhodospirillaceae bacterium]OUX69233.1 MAG: hypothetical protein CBD00_05965 [Rhodospirillaceae bacterium TMED140]
MYTNIYNASVNFCNFCIIQNGLERQHSSERHTINRQRTPPVTNLATFWNKIATKYAQDPVLDEAAYNFTCERSISYLQPGFRALEIGCGTGPTAIRLRPHVSAFEATDISPAMIDIAQGRQAGAAPDHQVTFRVASAPDSFADDTS